MDVIFVIDIVIKAEIETEMILVLTEIVTEVVLSDLSLLYFRFLEYFMSSHSLLYTLYSSYIIFVIQIP
jgi:hypothetical protein